MADNQCLSNGNGECGPFAAKGSIELFELSDLNRNVERHFKTLKINLPDTNDSLASIRTEKGFIIDRVSIKEESIPDNAQNIGIITVFTIISDVSVQIQSMKD